MGYVSLYVPGDRAGLRDVAGVEAVQSTLLAALQTHCTTRYGRHAGRVMLGRLLAHLPELRSVARTAGDALATRLRTGNDSTELAVLRRIADVIDHQPAAGARPD